jgi:hypothetical protein
VSQEQLHLSKPHMTYGLASVCGTECCCRQDRDLTAAASRFIKLSIPALWCTGELIVASVLVAVWPAGYTSFGDLWSSRLAGVFEASKRYLTAQGVVRPASVVTLVGLALTPLYGWLFVFKLGLALDGAAYTVDATQVALARSVCTGCCLPFTDPASVPAGLPGGAAVRVHCST